ncbi:MAG: VWA domain-containing protein [Calditrichaceae bacterium]|nr:VWA domain-containing protein [Calditrichaceae bacterium]
MIKVLLVILLFSGIILANGVAIIDAESGTFLDLIESNIQVNVENQVAIISSMQTFKNLSGSAKVVKYGFPLPGSASATALRWKINGIWYEASFAPTPQDTTTPGPGGSMAEDLKAYLGDTPIYYDVEQAVKADSSLLIELTYVQLLPYEFGNVDFIYPNDYSKIQSAALDEQQICLNLTSLRTINSIQMLSDHDSIRVINDGSLAVLTSKTYKKPATLDYHIQYSLSLDELGLYSLSTFMPADKVPDGHGGFFVYIAEPDPSDAGDIINKYFTIIIDHSGSMYGTKMTQAKNAASFIIENLNEGDWFNIVDFSSDVTSMNSYHTAFNNSTKAQALTYIDNISATGGTNIASAFDTATLQFTSAGDSTANIIIFLTDGEATVGITEDNALIEHINQTVAAIDTNINIYCFGIGNDVQKKVLTSISVENNGFAEFLEDDILEERLTNFYLKIRNPVLLHTSMAFSVPVVSETYPDPLPNLYKGQQMIVSGRYSEAVPLDVTLKGEAFGEEVTYNYALNLIDSVVQKYQFLPKIWAKLKIEHLLIEYYLLNESAEIKNEIIELSLAYGVISPFTSFGDATDIDDETEPVKLVKEYELLGNFPNPFNPSTTIQFKVSKMLNRVVTIKIYDTLGRLVRILSIVVTHPGHYEMQWDGKLDNGLPAASGNYFYLVDFGEAILAGKMQLLK